MPMDPNGLKTKMQATIYNGLKAQFGGDASEGAGYSSIADTQWQSLATAISGIALDIITEIITNGQVDPGIPTAGSPAAQVTVAPGKLS